MAYNYQTWVVTYVTAAQNDEIHSGNVRDMENIEVKVIRSGDLSELL